MSKLMGTCESAPAFVFGHTFVDEYLTLLDERSPEHVGAKMREIANAEANAERPFDPVFDGDGQGNLLRHRSRHARARDSIMRLP